MQLSFVAQWLLTFNVNVVNEDLFTKRWQILGNQSSVVSLQVLMVRLSVGNDVFPGLKRAKKDGSQPLSRLPSEYKFIVRVSVVNELFIVKLLFKLRIHISHKLKSSSLLTVNVRVVTLKSY